jgi:hypothetical protein
MIRQAVPSDIYRLIQMGQAYATESGWDKFAEFDTESYAFSCGVLIDSGILLVVEQDGVLVGMVAAAAAPAMLNRNVLLGQELWWWCEPALRKGSTPKHMKKALEKAFEARGFQKAGALPEKTAERVAARPFFCAHLAVAA